MSFNYALSPIFKPEIAKIIEKIDSMIKIGISDFSIFFDDIKVPLTKKMAEAQVNITNRVYEFLRARIPDTSLFFCPTQYCGFKKTEYILTIARELNNKIQIFWTGRDVVAKSITKKDVDSITNLIGRSPLIWDNIFANDYIPNVILKFPYKGREPEIISRVNGILINPMNQYKKSKSLIYTAAKFFNDPYKYNTEDAWQKATG